MNACWMFRVKTITRDDLQALPDVLFAFGDNMSRQGFGGQARHMRGEPNAVGIPTKHAPTNQSSAFFADGDFSAVKSHIDDAFKRLASHVKSGKPIVFPEDGIGTGRADLVNKAPLIADYIDRCTRRLALLAGAQPE